MVRAIKKTGSLIAIAVFATILALPTASARTSLDGWTLPGESQLTSHRHYRTKNGDEVHSPSATKSGGVPAGATARCGDGTYGFSRHHSGTCSRHGGVAQWE